VIIAVEVSAEIAFYHIKRMIMVQPLGLEILLYLGWNQSQCLFLPALDTLD
jgi:hypothetical protein